MADLGYFKAGITWTPAVGAGPSTDLEFGVTDAQGTWWLITDWQGLDGVATAGQVVQKAGDHGAWATPQWYGPRTITLTVQATAQTQALRDVARAYLQQAIPVSDLALLTWNDPVPVQMAVRRSGPIVETYMTLNDVVFSVPLVAPDPRKYSTSLHSLTANQQTFASGIAPPLTPPLTLPAGFPPMVLACTNAGSFETRPTITIQGPLVGPGVTNQTTGQAVSFSTLTLGVSDVLTLDFNLKQATLNGSPRVPDVASSWWLLPPGTTTVQVTGTPSAGSKVTVAWRDAWI